VAVASAAAVVVWRRRRGAREHVDLYFADGSMVTFAEGSMEGGRLLPIAHSILAAAR
jgi:hypothetical protein